MATCGRGVNVHFYLENVLMFNVREELDKTLLTLRNNFSGPMPGVVRPSLNWSIREAPRSFSVESIPNT
jgi:hypothetical protein